LQYFKELILSFFRLSCHPGSAEMLSKRSAKIIQNFKTTKLFLTFFHRRLAAVSERASLFRDCGCKGNHLFLFRKFFRNYFFTKI
ncbi:hypothetical protein, partial [Millionella massiliensis]|uniref:hypothetical protein n=1 Tax=Millionella massiliensis TaxID=1871023 RepID=UPI0023A7F412